ncbi:MAG: DUF4160 domain-containing protein [Deltaproteobacteria bacterium]|nr:DUF4160 domain-containing protein [Deltaproteobacteria bacterium]
MSPTVFQAKGFRFFFFSREEKRIHVHVHCGGGEAKFWVEPEVKLVQNYGLKEKELQEARKLIEEHVDEIKAAWKKHFGS